MARYRKKPVEVTAVQLCWRNWGEVCDTFAGLVSALNPARYTDKYSETCGEAAPYMELFVPTLEGVMVARHGDYIVEGIDGEYFACKPEIFRATYELVED